MPLSLKDFIDLCDQGTSQEICDAVRMGIAVDESDEQGWTALMLAAGSLDAPELIELLLDAGSDVHARDRSGRTPLMHAAWNNESTAVIHTLVDRGANLNAQDNQGRTPLMGVRP